MNENDVARIVVDAAFRIHHDLGSGLLESAYERVLDHVLRTRGLRVTRQQPVALEYAGLRIERAYRCDIVVHDLVIVEIKSVDFIARAHTAQLLTQLRLTGLRLGLLVNFGSAMFKNGVKRVVNGLPDYL